MSQSPAAPSYAAVLRTRHACRTFGAALVGRLSYGTVSLSLLLATREATDSYAVAGTVMALFGLSSVLLSPARAGLIDRYGPRRALPPMATGYALVLAGLALATARNGVSGVPLGVLAVAAGASTPPLGPVMRTLWSDLLPEPGLLRRAYSLDGVAEELLFVTGPLLVGLLTQVASPSLGLAGSAVLVLTGSLALVGSPAVRAAGPGAGRRATAAATGPALPAGPPPGRRVLSWSGPQLRPAIAVAAGVGTSLAALELLAVVVVDEHHTPGMVGWVMAALSAGSAVGGLVHGAVSWRASAQRRLAACAAALGLVLAVTGLTRHPFALVGWAALGGLFVAPALTTAYLIADESADPGFRTRAGAWVNTAFNAGSAGAAAGTGLLVGRLPLPACFLLAAAPALLSAATALRRGPRVTTGRRRAV